MATQEAPKAAAPKVSSKLLQLKFMQRAVEKSQPPAQPSQEPAAAAADAWVAPASRRDAAPCRVLHEADPPPGALLGRLSFRKFNAETEKLQADAEAEEARQRGGGDGGKAAAVAVSDAEMAATLRRGTGVEPAGKRRKGAEAGFVKPPPFQTTE